MQAPGDGGGGARGQDLLQGIPTEAGPAPSAAGPKCRRCDELRRERVPLRLPHRGCVGWCSGPRSPTSGQPRRPRAEAGTKGSGIVRGRSGRIQRSRSGKPAGRRAQMETRRAVGDADACSVVVTWIRARHRCVDSRPCKEPLRHQNRCR